MRTRRPKAEACGSAFVPEEARYKVLSPTRVSTVHLPEYLLHIPVLVHGPPAQTEARVATHQQAVTILVAAVLLQNLVAAPDALWYCPVSI